MSMYNSHFRTIIYHCSTKHEMGSNNGTFDITFALYKDAAYSQPVLTNTSIDVSKNIYARLRLKTSSTSLKMTVQSCIPSPHNTPLEYETYTHALIKGRLVYINLCFFAITLQFVFVRIPTYSHSTIANA